MVLEKTLESPLNYKEIQPVHSEGDQPWDFLRGNDAEAETSFSSSSLSAIRVVSSAYLRLLIFLPAILIPACVSSRHMNYRLTLIASFFLCSD